MDDLVDNFVFCIQSLDSTKTYVRNLFIQRSLFKNIVLKSLLDSGNYEINLSKEDVESYEGYDLEAEILGDVIKISVVFPKESVEDD